MGPYRGGQAELLTVPYGDFNCLRLHDDAEEKETDYVMLADIWPTGWHATELAGVKPGETVVVYGCGPVGLMAAYSAIVKGAAQVYIVDRHPDRLKLAESIGAIPIDDSKDDPVEAVMELTHGLGADRGCECVGWQAHDPQGHEHPNMTLNKLFQSVRATGGLGIIGVFTKDPKSPDPLLKEGELALDIASFFEKGLQAGSGQADVKRYNRHLRDLIHDDRAAPSFLVSHELPLDRGARCVQALRRAGEGVDQGHPPSGRHRRAEGAGPAARGGEREQARAAVAPDDGGEELSETPPGAEKRVATRRTARSWHAPGRSYSPGAAVLRPTAPRWPSQSHPPLPLPPSGLPGPGAAAWSRASPPRAA